ncbi:MAG TPA: signal peptide peptidase SppA [Planctomycetota bacterium]|nr:signal peptide peptidase SppA [Planctomycetota bacterium]
MRISRSRVPAWAVAAAWALATGAAAAEAAKGAEARTVRVVEVLLQGDIEEQRAVENPFGPRSHVLREYTASLRKAAKDDEVHGVLLRLNHPALGMAKLQELRDAVDEVKAAGKRVYCYLEACGNADYLLACSADRIGSPPGGMVLLTGLRAQATFFKGLLDWAGIQAEILHFGKHKSAGESLTRDSMSEENRQVLNELLDDLYVQFVAVIAKGRNLTEQKVKETIDNGPYCAKDARIYHLVDEVSYFDQFVEAMGKDLGGKVTLVKGYHHLGARGPDLSELNLFSFFAALKPKPDIPATDRPKVVILYASGMIVMGEGGALLGTVITAEALQRAFTKIRENPTVRAVVLRVDSPGGSALVSDLIWREVERTQKAGKPVVASLSDVAASGGYYIAMGTDAIVAQPGTVTGSIGVLGGKVVLRGLYDKIGLTKEVFTRGRNAALFSDYTPFSATERKRVEALMSDIYNDFVHKAALGRKMPHEKMQELATGRVWTARAAKELGLVDVLGGLREAYDLAVEKAGLKGKDVQPVVLPREKSFLEALLAPSAGAVQSRIAASLPAPMLRSLPYAEVLASLARENVLALMPYFVEIR